MNGQIIEQGSYEDLMASSGYVSTLASTSLKVNTSRAPDVVLDDETLQDLKLDVEEADTMSRQTGDWSIYLYYFQVIGWPLLFLFFSCAVLFIFGLISPRKQITVLFPIGYQLTLN